MELKNTWNMEFRVWKLNSGADIAGIYVLGRRIGIAEVLLRMIGGAYNIMPERGYVRRNNSFRWLLNSPINC